MYNRKRAPLISAALFVPAFAYGLLVRFRCLLYETGVLRKKTLPITVISVGNLTLGGTGKTPAVLNVASLLRKHGRMPAVISRGYGRKNEAALVTVSDGVGVLVDAETGGDEPVLIGSKLKGLPVVAGSDRFLAGQFALQHFHPDTIILDDGFQHLRLNRNINVVLVDGTNPFGNGKLFPAGILREPLTSLLRADIVLITRSEQTKDLESLKARLRQFTNARILTSNHVPVDLIDSVSGEIKPLSSLRRTDVFVFSGIAHPASFSALLRSLGAEVKAEAVFPDHYAYTRSDLASIYQQAADKRVSMIITTEKDAVRLRALKPEGIWALRIELQVCEQEAWEKALLEER